MELTRSQRKALRRLSRGQSITRSAYHDPLIQKCIDRTHYITPPDITTMPYPESMFVWEEWEAKARRTNRPRLNDHGKQLLKQYEAQYQLETINDPNNRTNHHAHR